MIDIPIFSFSKLLKKFVILNLFIYYFRKFKVNKIHCRYLFVLYQIYIVELFSKVQTLKRNF